MPVPWPTDRDRIRIENIAERALTIKQLSDLRTFLQRLCKAKLLCRTEDDKSHKSKSAWPRPGQNGQTPDGVKKKKQQLSWHELNLYDVTDEVIKPLIYYREMALQLPSRPWQATAQCAGLGETRLNTLNSIVPNGNMPFFGALDVVDPISSRALVIRTPQTNALNLLKQP